MMPPSDERRDMEKKSVNQVIQEHKETVHTYIERVIDRDMEGKPGYTKFRRLFPKAAAELFEGFWNYHHKRTIIFLLDFYARFVVCYCIWAITEVFPDIYKRLCDNDYEVDEIIDLLIDFEKVNRDRLFREAEEELKETCKKQGIPLMEIVK